MRFVDLTAPSLAANLALDEALLLAAEQPPDGEWLRVWEWPRPAVILGAGCSLSDDVDEAACAADGVPILRRASGGGTVLLGRGCLLFSLVRSFERTPELAHIGISYRYILERICRALSVADLRLAGTSDLSMGDRKVSGNAQQRKRTHLLHHGSLLYSFDAAQVSRYLRTPARQPQYRQQRSHADFLANLPLTRGDIVKRLREAFDAQEGALEIPNEPVRLLVESKYGREEWTRRR
jgi:lipoate-protein ligase A